jgi:hypothetical protein
VAAHDRTGPGDPPKRQTATATPAKPGDLLWTLEQLCDALHKKTNLTIFLIDDGFNVETKSKSYVFDLGQFWRKVNGIKGRFQENGFFYYMTMFYDCDVVHVGMKSGGMDSLGLWGQKVVFIDSLAAEKITDIRKRVEAWNTDTLKPVRVGQLPTKLGQAIEKQRDDADKGKEEGKAEKPFKTTFSSVVQVNKMTGLTGRTKGLLDGFSPEDLDKICLEVTTMLSLQSKIMGSMPSGYNSGKSKME